MGNSMGGESRAPAVEGKSVRFRWLLPALGGALALVVWPYVRPLFSAGMQAAVGLLGRAGLWGPLVVVGLQVLQAVVAPLPSWPVTMAAGARYGPVHGTLYSLIGGTLGGAINFILARRLGRRLVRRWLGERWIERAGRLQPIHLLGLALLGRLIPAASFDIVAYLAGVSHVSFLAFMAVSAIGQAPAFLIYAISGNDLTLTHGAGLQEGLLLLLILALVAFGHRLWKRLSA